MFNGIAETNESKTWTKHISCKCKCKFNRKGCSLDQWQNDKKCWYECKKRHVCEKDYIWNPTTCSYQNRKYLASVMDDSVIQCDKFIEPQDEETKTVPASFNQNKATCQKQNFYILLVLILITIELLIAVSIYCYLIKYQAK